MDWVRLGGSGVDLAGTKGIVTPVSHAELSKHNRRNDAWIAIRGKVFNVTQYLDFHPGGVDELMKGVGKDATKMFDEVHAWVNYEQLLNKCFIGPLRTMVMIDLNDNKPAPAGANSKTTAGHIGSNAFRLPFSISANNFITATSSIGENKDTAISESLSVLTGSIDDSPLAQAVGEVKENEIGEEEEERQQEPEKIEITPRFDWIQKTTEFTLIFYTKSLSNPGLLVEQQLSDLGLEVRVIIANVTHLFTFTLLHGVQWPCTVRNVIETGKIELAFTKSEPSLWTSFGTVERKKIVDFEIKETEFDVISRSEITHDSVALVLRPLGKVIQVNPIGHHVSITGRIKGHEITRSYTPVPHSYLQAPCPNSCIVLLVKNYANGGLSKFLARASPLASSLRITPPKGQFSLIKLRSHLKIALVAAGSGITPFLLLIDHLLNKSSNQL